VNHASVPFVTGLPAEDIRDTDWRDPAYRALLLHRRVAADLCARHAGTPAVANLDAATSPCLHTNTLVCAHLYAGRNVDSHRNPEAWGKRHLHLNSHSHADAHTLCHTHTYGYPDADSYSDDDPHRHSDRHPHQHADTHEHIYDHTHADALTYAHRDVNVDAQPDTYRHTDTKRHALTEQYTDTERHADVDTDLYAKPDAFAARSVMLVAGEQMIEQGPKICRQRDT
jgi:hypothetical protein